MVVEHLAQRGGHATGEAQQSVGHGTEGVVRILGAVDVAALIPECGDQVRHIGMEFHRTGLLAQTAHLGNLAGHCVEPPLHVGRDGVGIEAALVCVAQHEVRAHTVVTTDDHEAFVVGCIEHIVGTGLGGGFTRSGISHGSAGGPQGLVLQLAALRLKEMCCLPACYTRRNGFREKGRCSAKDGCERHHDSFHTSRNFVANIRLFSVTIKF